MPSFCIEHFTLGKGAWKAKCFLEQEILIGTAICRVYVEVHYFNNAVS